jgi:hypothetical protein
VSPVPITEIRALICSAMAELGGTCERLRELEDPDLCGAVVESAREDIAAWLDQAAVELNRAARLAEYGKAETSEPVAEAITKLGGKIS